MPCCSEVIAHALDLAGDRRRAPCSGSRRSGTCRSSPASGRSSDRELSSCAEYCAARWSNNVFCRPRTSAPLDPATARGESVSGELGLFAGDLGIQAVDLLLQLIDVGDSEGRVQRRELTSFSTISPSRTSMLLTIDGSSAWNTSGVSTETILPPVLEMTRSTRAIVRMTTQASRAAPRDEIRSRERSAARPHDGSRRSPTGIAGLRRGSTR